MNNRFFATLIVVCLAFAGGGCASEAQRKKNEDAPLLPRQTGSNLNRRMNVEPDSSSKPKKKKKEDSKPAAKKPAKTEKAEPEKAKEPKAPKPPKPEPTPEETTTQPEYGALAKRCFRPLSHLTNSLRE